ncbi:unnamed protein product, partial [Ectocarpus sp. 8 AP-2014]
MRRNSLGSFRMRRVGRICCGSSSPVHTGDRPLIPVGIWEKVHKGVSRAVTRRGGLPAHATIEHVEDPGIISGFPSSHGSRKHRRTHNRCYSPKMLKQLSSNMSSPSICGKSIVGRC